MSPGTNRMSAFAPLKKYSIEKHSKPVENQQDKNSHLGYSWIFDDLQTVE
jgi:hypothetical protein